MARPEGPGAAPFRDHLNAVSSLWVGICNGCSGANHVISAGMGVYGCNGRLAGSWSCAKVAWVPGAGGVAMRACHAADNSPWCTKCLARWALLAEASVCCCAGGLCLVQPGVAATPRVGKQPGVDAILLWARCVCQAAGAGACGAGGAKGSRHGWIHHPCELQ